MKLVDTLDDQEILEDRIEATKPVLPTECRALDYLLAAPFRYDTIYPKGSRFRRAEQSHHYPAFLKGQFLWVGI